ncbi:NitT/TauT family transport system substrate-binding protein [Quadrisphaera granulorum]|uniref:Thiamine pyrimidine synthase n=1 Tax=Quadrisphaera granulorum TaxID=317664 RepID=A0A316A4Q0_9ACTN|nr:ABC transporter substrate-binding protein [Quadrisphaera granulorum]PWJ52881.1 NitT/TauT family transport system substrate-binding protein [Quadrisphaera granulorum]SZE97263.1 NitT/TauT family transport system substrate-binding protein [Quadrisphaera granulorum]
MNRSRTITRRSLLAGALAAAGTGALAACGTADAPATGTATTGGASGSASGLKPVKLQLQWFKQAQFAGYLAALDQGYYEAEGLDVTIVDGGTDIVPQTVLAQGQVDYAIAWVPKALASREQGAGITDVAQVFQRSGTRQVSFASAGIKTVADLRGKTVGNWGFGNEFELFAAMTKAGLDPATDVTLVQQQFDMNAFIAGDIAAAQAMTYNEYAQVLEAKNPATGQLFQPSDLTTLDWNEVGTAMLQDAIWANTEKLSDSAYADQTTAFIKASLKGWVFARDNPEKARDITVAAGSTLGASHQLWQVNEVNKLIWPSPSAGVGSFDKTLWDQTVQVALQTKNADGATVITKEPDSDAYSDTYVTAALKALTDEGVDVVGASFAPTTVTLTEGGA